MKPGKDYESFVGKLQTALIESDTILHQKNIHIEQNKTLEDQCGIIREFDLYWEYEFAGVIYKTIIECKDYATPIGVEKIDALIGKLHDLPGIKPVFATTIGYQSGAKLKAERNGIELLIVREQNEKDWIDPNGNPYLRKISINMVLHSQISITAINPFLDKEWLEQNTKIKIDDLKDIHIMSEETFIEDQLLNTKNPLIWYLEKVDENRDEQFGEHEFRYLFDDAYIVVEDKRMKIRELHIKYIRPEPITMPMEIDYTKELIGVIEYFSRKEKAKIFSNGNIVKERDN